MSDLLETLTLERLRGLASRAVELVTPEGQRVPLELIEVTDLGRRPPGFRAPGGVNVREECFSLIFEGPASPPIPQGTWRLEFPELGAGEVFLVPIAASGGPVLAAGLAAGAAPAMRRYEAIFY